LIQFNLKGFQVIEIPISFIERFRAGFLGSFRYGVDAVKLSVNFRLHQMSIYYERKFDISSGADKYTLKAGYPSSHQYTLNEVRDGSRVLDIGCGNSLVGAELMKLGCWVEAIDCENSKGLSRVNKFTKMNLNDENENISVHSFDYVLLLDVLEHLEEPEKFVWNLRMQAHGKSPNIIVSVPNIGFFVMRLQLLFGRFNYGIKGILDMGHRRLFTFYTIRKMLGDAGFKILKCKGIPAPYPKAIGDNILSRSLMKINSLLVRVFPELFSYQIFIVVEPLPTLDSLLESRKNNKLELN
jgi:SAM-dependent methyltransferase